MQANHTPKRAEYVGGKWALGAINLKRRIEVANAARQRADAAPQQLALEETIRQSLSYTTATRQQLLWQVTHAYLPQGIDYVLFRDLNRLLTTLRFPPRIGAQQNLGLQAFDALLFYLDLLSNKNSDQMGDKLASRAMESLLIYYERLCTPPTKAFPPVHYQTLREPKHWALQDHLREDNASLINSALNEAIEQQEEKSGLNARNILIRYFSRNISLPDKAEYQGFFHQEIPYSRGLLPEEAIALKRAFYQFSSWLLKNTTTGKNLRDKESQDEIRANLYELLIELKATFDPDKNSSFVAYFMHQHTTKMFDKLAETSSLAKGSNLTELSIVLKASDLILHSESGLQKKHASATEIASYLQDAYQHFIKYIRGSNIKPQSLRSFLLFLRGDLLIKKLDTPAADEAKSNKKTLFDYLAYTNEDEKIIAIERIQKILGWLHRAVSPIDDTEQHHHEALTRLILQDYVPALDSGLSNTQLMRESWVEAVEVALENVSQRHDAKKMLILKANLLQGIPLETLAIEHELYVTKGKNKGKLIMKAESVKNFIKDARDDLRDEIEAVFESRIGFWPLE